MHAAIKLIIAPLLAGALPAVLSAAEWYVAPQGKRDAEGTKAAPWDIESALGGGQKVAAGDTLWIAGGTYQHPDRKVGGMGFTVRLAGETEKPIHVRAIPGERVTIDGGLTVKEPSTWLRISDLEILVSENFSLDREVKEPGSHPQSYNRPWGGLNVYSGTGCKFVNLTIHDNAQGVSFWSGAVDGELYGCVIYDNGWKAPDRGHGHAVYTQNKDGTKTIADCIMTGGFGYTMHAYGSSRAYVDNYLVEGNVAYDGGTFLIGGGRPSHNINVTGNVLYNVNLQLGYSAPHNEDCVIRDNVILAGGLNINKYKTVVNEDNAVLNRDQARAAGPRVLLRPNRYDPRRANLAVYRGKAPADVPVPVQQLKEFLRPGDRYRVMNPRQLYGKPVAVGRYESAPIRVPVQGEFSAFVVFRQGDEHDRQP